MMLIFLIVGLLGVVMFEAPRLIKNKLYKELAAFFLLWGLASFMAVAQFYGVDLSKGLKIYDMITLRIELPVQ